MSVEPNLIYLSVCLRVPISQALFKVVSLPPASRGLVHEDGAASASGVWSVLCLSGRAPCPAWRTDRPVSVIAVSVCDALTVRIG